MIAVVEGLGFYLLVPQVIILWFHMLAMLHGLGIVGIPDGSITYFGMWFRYMPSNRFLVNALFWAACFVVAFWLWDRFVDFLVWKKVVVVR